VCLSDTGATLGIQLKKWTPSSFVRQSPAKLVEIEQTSEFWQSVPRNRYFLTKLPEVDMTQLILQQRSYILQICLPPELEVYDVMPWDRWDDEDQLLFCSGDLNRACGTLKIKGRLPALTQGHHASIPIECVFFALEWGHQKQSELQCTIVEYCPLNRVIDEIRNRLVEHDLCVDQMKEDLKNHKDPCDVVSCYRGPKNRTMR